MKYRVLTLFWIFLFSAQLGAQNLEVGEEAYKNDEYELALEHLRPLAEEGNPRALYILADMYIDGEAVAQDIERGLKLLEESADADYPEAHKALGDLLDPKWSPDDLKPYTDAEKSEAWFRSAARIWLERMEEGDLDAKYRLAQLYRSEDNIFEISSKQILEMLIDLANRGHIYAQITLGQDYMSGRNNVEREVWFGVNYWAMAAEQGNVYAQKELGRIYRHDILAQSKRLKRIGPETGEHVSMAMEWYERAAEQGDVEAKEILAEMYLDGEGWEDQIDYAKAYQHLEDLGNTSNWRVHFMLGKIYMGGKGVLQDYVQAHKHFNLASLFASRLRYRSTRYKAERIAEIHSLRKEIEARMSDAALERAQGLAKEYMSNLEE